MFSESELEATRWFGHVNGLSRLPSVKSVKRNRKDIVDVAGTNPEMFTSAMGNMYTMANLGAVLQHVSSVHELFRFHSSPVSHYPGVC